MNTRTRSPKLFRWLALTTQVLAVGVMISLSAHAQVQNQQLVSQDKAADAVTSVEPSSTGAGTLSAKPVAEPTIPPPSTNKWTGFYGGGHVGYGWAGPTPALHRCRLLFRFLTCCQQRCVQIPRASLLADSLATTRNLHDRLERRIHHLVVEHERDEDGHADHPEQRLDV